MALYSLYDIVVNMKKLSNLIFVHREGLEQKWWHRLAKVLIWGSTAAVLILGFILFYNTQPKLDTVANQGLNASELNIDNGNYIGHTRFVSETNQLVQYGYSNNKSVNKISSVLNKFYSQGAQDIKSEAITAGYSDAEVTTIVQEYQTENYPYIKNLEFKMKINSLTSFLYPILIAVGWFIFWGSIVYRAIIYIAYGKKK